MEWDRAAVFEELRRRECTSAEVYFNDEGEIERVVLLPSGADIEPEYPLWRDGGYKALNFPQALCLPVDEEYQGFDGVPDVNGMVIWDALKKTVRLEGEEEQPVPFKREL